MLSNGISNNKINDRRKKLDKKRNLIFLLIIVFFYIYIMFISEIDIGTGKKELENIIILAIPCFIYLIQSLNITDKIERKKYLYYYLIIYITAIIGFTFSNFRTTYKHLGNINFVREYNLIPFNSVITLLKTPLGLNIGLYNIIGNLLMLTPLAILLPLINDKFKKKKYFIILIIIISFSIESLQYITNYGSFDIDDIILNSIGAIILYLIVINSKIYKLIYKLFYEVTIRKRIANYIKIFLYFILIFIYIIYILNIYQIYKDNKFDYSNLICKDNSRTYITTFGEYDYYSECNYSRYIIKGSGQQLDLKDYLKIDTSDKTLNKLKVTKEKWLMDIKIDYNDNLLKLLDDDGKTKTYLFGIDKLKIKSNKTNNIIIIDTKLSDEFNYFALVNLIETSSTYAIYTGKYYNVIGCGKALSLKAENYIISKKYDYDNNFCNKIKSLKY